MPFSVTSQGPLIYDEGTGTAAPYGLGSNPTPGSLDPTSGNPNSGTSLQAQLLQEFPWLQQMGLPVSWFQNVAATSTNGDEIVAQIRQTAQYKATFPSITRPDGTMRTTEAGYLQTQQTYRQLLTQFGYGKDYVSPQSLSQFFDSEIDPNELNTRLDTFQKIKDSGQSVKDAFYVYAGLNLSDDDLYNATVDETYGKNLQAAYTEAAGNTDYATWLSRASQVAKSNSTDMLNSLVTAGIITQDMAHRVLQDGTSYGTTILDALYHGGDPVNGEKLDLTSLVNAYTNATIAAAATGAGLQMPTLDRINEFRSAGLSQSKALQAYQTYGMSADAINASVQRAKQHGFGQADYENAAFLGSASAAQDLAAGQAYDEASGKDAGTFQFGQAPTGRFTQKGFQAPF